MTSNPDPAGFRRILARNLTLPLALGVLSALLFISLIAYLLGTIRDVERADQALSRAYALQKLDLQMEASLRGFLLTGDESFLQSFEQSATLLQPERNRLRELLDGNPQQLERLARSEELQKEWNAFAAGQIALKRQEPSYAPGERIHDGRRIKRVIREEFEQIVGAQQQTRQEYTEKASRNTIWTVAAFVAFMLGMGGLLAWRGRTELLALSASYDLTLQEQQRQAAALQAQAWMREGQSLLAERLAREQQLQGLATGALEFFSQYLGAVVGVVYLPYESGGYERIATWGWDQDAERSKTHKILLAADRTLVAEAATQRRQIVLDEVPQDYLRVASGLGHATSRAVLVAPIENERRLCAIVELGFLRPLAGRDGELVQLCASALGAALESARYRRRLQDVLEETQQLNEELQTQQEELRTANEELEEQSRALKESQAHLEHQQAELEQTNLQLSEHTQRLADQRDALAQAQSELAVRAQELQRASRYKSEFLANMSHELRTPLNSALILARLLADNPQGNLSEEQVKFAESIYASGNDLLHLINDILDIAKVEAGKLDVRPETAPVAAIAESLRSMFEPLAQRRGLHLAIEVAPGTAAQLYSDRQRVEQILKNLLSNAVKFTERGSVALQVRPDSLGIAFEVRDSGIGIDPSQHELIFEAFRQADGTVNRKYGGTGLGLSISRDLARLLGGSLTVDSTPGQGSTFTLALPLHYQPALAQKPLSLAAPGTAPDDAPITAGSARAPAPPRPAPAQRAAPEPPAAAREPTAPAFPDDRGLPADERRGVLIVEDDTVFARILFDLAHELGFRAIVAHNAEDGVRLAQEHLPQAVLLDMRLPDDSGLAVLQRLKENPRTRHMPVHVLSAEDLTEPALQMGAVGYALKPATREQLRDIFARLESKLNQKLKRVLVVEDDPRQRESVAHLIAEGDVEITTVGLGQEALDALARSVYDCMIMDLKLPDMNGQELLKRMAAGETRSFPPVIVYTGRNLSREEESELLRYSNSIIIKGARSPERLLDEVTLFLHQVESQLSSERQKMLRTARTREKAFEGRRILVVDDDVRNIFALTSALEHKGAQVEVGRNGVEALRKLAETDAVDMVLMDIMMPEMDGYTAMREIRRNPAWQKLPIIAITAKAMKDDQERCLAAGASDYLAKPIELERLFSLMRVWMPKMERL
jgi:CheY-like chemotaxis protein/signal transduction histidine kinase/CHASE3 domain sensor protein